MAARNRLERRKNPAIAAFRLHESAYPLLTVLSPNGSACSFLLRDCGLSASSEHSAPASRQGVQPSPSSLVTQWKPSCWHAWQLIPANEDESSAMVSKPDLSCRLGGPSSKRFWYAGWLPDAAAWADGLRWLWMLMGADGLFGMPEAMINIKGKARWTGKSGGGRATMSPGRACGELNEGGLSNESPPAWTGGGELSPRI